MVLAAALLCAAHPVYALKAVVSAVAVRRDGNAYRASASLRFTIVTTSHAPPSASAHARGHYVIAQRVAQSSIGRFESTAPGARAARAQVLRAIAQMTADAEHELRREERVYDSVTEDGAAQNLGPQYGFPGGANLRDPCPDTAR